MIHPLTEESAAAERRRLLNGLQTHRRLANQHRRALDQLDAECRRHGIRLIREPLRPAQGERRAGTDPHT